MGWRDWGETCDRKEEGVRCSEPVLTQGVCYDHAITCSRCGKEPSRGGLCDPCLDGTDAEFPHRAQAMDRYRELWNEYRRSRRDNPEVIRSDLGREMDREQDRICRGPGPIWREFYLSLPQGPMSSTWTWRTRILKWLSKWTRSLRQRGSPSLR